MSQPSSKTVSPARVAARRDAALAVGSAISGAIRTKINAALIRSGMDGNGRFRSTGEALSKINRVLEVFRIEWDEVLQSFLLNQPSGRMNISLASQTDDHFSPVSIRSTSLAFHWTTLESGIEVVAYLG
jgi:hypothetical protein